MNIRECLAQAILWLRYGWSIVHPTSWAAGWSIVGLLVFGFVPQGREILLWYAERFEHHGLSDRHVLFLLLGVATATFAIWYACRAILSVIYPHRRAKIDLYREAFGTEGCDRVAAALRRWTPRTVAVLPGCGIALGLWLGGGGTGHEDAALRLALVVGVVQASLMIFLVVRRRVPASIRRREAGGRETTPPATGGQWSDEEIARLPRSPGHATDRLPIGTRRWVRRALLASGLLIVLFLTPTPTVPQFLGSGSLILIAIGLFGFLGTICLVHPIHRLGASSTTAWAVLPLLLLTAVLARAGLTDNHDVRRLTGEEEAREAKRVAERPSLERHLAGWLSARAGLASEASPYPLVVAAAQGGGLRAAMWTAVVLGALQDRDESFACSLFAVSGVSGGAVGALAFVAGLPEKLPCDGKRPSGACLLNDSLAACQPGRTDLADRLAEAFTGDFLAPTLAGGLFPDLVQKLTPTGLVGFTLPDRQQFLELAWEHRVAGLASAVQPHGFVQVVRPEPHDRARPALFLVASEVEKGRRWIASDVWIDRQIFVDAVDTLTGQEHDGEAPAIVCSTDSSNCRPRILALPASAAAGLSARFPYVSPPGMLHFAEQGGPDRVFHLLDGGIVESSGAATAADILNAIRGWCEVAGAGTLRCILHREDKQGEFTRFAKDDPLCRDNDVAPSCQAVYLRPAVLQLTNDPWNQEAAEGRARPRASWLAELLDPIRGLLNSRTGRGRAAHDRLAGDRSLMAGRDDLDRDVDLVDEDGRTAGGSVPLGWMVRQDTASRMTAQAANKLASDKQREWLCRVYGAGRGASGMGQDLLPEGLRHEPGKDGSLGQVAWRDDGRIAVSADTSEIRVADRSWSFCLSGEQEREHVASLDVVSSLPPGFFARILLDMNGMEQWHTVCGNDSGLLTQARERTPDAIADITVQVRVIVERGEDPRRPDCAATGGAGRRSGGFAINGLRFEAGSVAVGSAL